MPADSRLKRKMGGQLEWLHSSAAAYDNGRTSEAIRLAGIMRTLFSNSKKSAGLVFQLGGRRIFLNSTVPQFAVEPIQFCGLVDLVLSLEKDGKAEAIAPLDGSYLNKIKGHYLAVRYAIHRGPPLPWESPDHINQLIAHKWLNQPVFIYSPKQKLTRQNLFEAAANQDGAAHVDEELTPEYERLQRPGGINFEFQLQPGVPPILMRDVHLPALRQMAFELITSSALLALANDS
jgi:hypothetical protein